MTVETIDGISDGGLMRRVAEGDPFAFETIYDRYSPQAFALAMRMTRKPCAADEITQEAFVSLWRTAARYDPSRASLKTWLLMLVHSRGIDSIRSGKRHSRNLTIDEVSEDHLQAAESTDEDTFKRDTSRHLRHLLTNIPSKQREVIELAYFDELTQVEIAKSLDLPLGTVKSRVRLALARLHQTLANEARSPNMTRLQRLDI